MFNIFNNNKPQNKISEKDRIKGALFGFFVGDALGVPVEFINREELRKNRVTDMLEYGTHNQPKGTWSDDSSMVIATIDSLNNKKSIDYTDIMNNFLEWYKYAKYTPANDVFDIGNATALALRKYNNNKNNFKCGGSDIYTNGNGSLMRILPVSLYLHYTDDPIFDVVNNISSMTHAHIYSIFSCIIYTIFINEYLTIEDTEKAYHSMQSLIKKVLEDNRNSIIGNLDDLKKVFNRVIYNDISKYKEIEIKSTGYVIDSLEASFWCLLTTNNYSDAVLKAVNLGDDTDTIAALTGGLAGLIYGYNSIYPKWINSLQKKEYLDKLVENFISLIDYKKIKQTATKDSWKTIDFDAFDTVECNIKLTDKQMENLKKEYIPQTMEEHWFMYCDDISINYYRSWTGIQIFKGHYKLIDGEYVIYAIDINKNKNEYNPETLENAINLFKDLIKASC